jgi:hypothetical protein
MIPEAKLRMVRVPARWTNTKVPPEAIPNFILEFREVISKATPIAESIGPLTLREPLGDGHQSSPNEDPGRNPLIALPLVP